MHFKCPPTDFCPVSVIGGVVTPRMLVTSHSSKAFIALSDPKTTGQNLSGLIDIYGSLWYIQISFAVLFFFFIRLCKDLSLQHRRIQTVETRRKVTCDWLAFSPPFHILYVLPKGHYLRAM